VNSTTRTYTASISPAPPIVEVTEGATTFTKGQPAVIVDAGVIVEADGTPNFNGGSLTVSLIAGVSDGDVLSISSQGTGAGEISVTGTEVFFEGTKIGDITQTGSTGDPRVLQVTLNANSNATNVQALARRITFENTATTPDTVTRTARFEVSDGFGGTSAAADKSVEVLATVAPEVTTSAGATTWTEAAGTGIAAAVVIDSGVTVTDSKDPANYDGGSLTVSFAENGTADDRLAIRSQTTVGSINVSGNTVRVVISSGVFETIGTFTGGSGTTPLEVTLNANATVARTQLLARNITFQNVSQAPSTLARSVSFVVNDGQGGTSTPGLKTVNVVATNDLPTLGNLPTAVSYKVNASQVVTVAPNGTANDPDGPNWNNSHKLTVRFATSSQAVTGDEWGMSTSLGITFTGTTSGTVLHNGTVFAAFTRQASQIVFDFTSYPTTATQARVQDLLRSVTFKSTRTAVPAAPSPNPVSMRFLVQDAGGQSSYTWNLTFTS